MYTCTTTCHKKTMASSKTTEDFKQKVHSIKIIDKQTSVEEKRESTLIKNAEHNRLEKLSFHIEKWMHKKMDN